MRLLLLLIFTASSYFSYAGKTDLPVKEAGASAMSTCLPIVLSICLLVAGAVIFFEAKNKRRGKNE